jgi:serine/threonine-protein kinase
MSDTIFDRLSTALADRYAIERELGEGGMATVYLARDLKHDRNVAIKVLRPELAAVLGGERFVQEIKTTANLQHPHILPLFDSGEVAGFLYYVMPYVEGETLRDKLNRDTQLGIEEAVRITADVADALDYAHRQNVIHRDIKPENILLHDGRPLVADFGIALAVSAAAGGRMTETGLSLGTPHYMSPEQATAEKDLTNRSDIYSLGAVLYEMLAGEPPHTGSSAQQVIMKIVTEEVPPVTKVRKAVPPHVAAATAKALERLPADRFQSAAELRDVLTGARALVSDAAQRSEGLAPRRGRLSRAALWLLPWVVSVVVVLAVLALSRPGTPASLPRHFDLLLPDSAPVEFIGEAFGGVGQTALALSSDGTLLAYAGSAGGTTQLYLRNLRDGAFRTLAGTEGANYPFFSPDGSWIGFFADDVLKKVSVGTGQVIALAPTPNPYGADWGPRGDIVVNIKDGTENILVPEAGGSVRPFPAHTEGAAPRAIAYRAIQFPRFLPGGEWILGGCVGNAVCIRSVETGDQLLITRSGPQKQLPGGEDAVRGTHPMYIPSGHLIYGRPGGVLAAVAFDVGSFSVQSDEVQLMQGIRRESPLTRTFQLAVSEDGTVVWAAGEDARMGVFVWADGAGRLDTLDFPRAQYNEFDLSDDRRWLATITTSESGQDELRVLDLARGGTFPWRDARFRPTWVGWGPTSQWLLVTSRGGVVLRVRRGAPSGGDTVFNEPGIYPNAFLNDTTLLALRSSVYGLRAYTVRFPALGADLIAGDIAETPLIEDGGNHLFPEPSPDGAWISYTSNASGPFEVYVTRNPPEGQPIRVSRGGGELGMWSADGRRLYYRNGRRWHYVERTGDVEPFSEPRLFLQGSFHNVSGKDHAISEDGRRLLLLRGPPDETTNVLHVITNWFEELERLVPRERN